MDMNINDKFTAVDFSVRNQSRSSTMMINLPIVCNKTKFKLESFITFEILIS